MRLSFFAKQPFLRENKQEKSGLYLQRVSSIIRAKEIAEFLGAKYNPKSGYKNDICIFIKPNSLEIIKDGDYIDPLDEWDLIDDLKKRPKVKVIAMSEPHYFLLKEELKNEVVLIPHHHINFERIKRKRRKVRTCGYVGTFRPYHRQINDQLRQKLKKIGLDFIELYNYKTRQDILDFYQQIDIQIIGHLRHIIDVPLYHATKIINAMSFGIPTITSPKLGYLDAEGFYIQVKNETELVNQAKQLKEDPLYYNMWVKKILPEAEKYHISEIAKLYQNLT